MILVRACPLAYATPINYNLFFLINKKDIYRRKLMQKNIRQREKYKGKRKRVKGKERKETKYTRES